MSIRDKFISESGIKVILENLKEWFPFKKKSKSGGVEIQIGENNEDSEEAVFSVGVPTNNGAKKNALEIQKDGDIFIYDRVGNKVNLQNKLNSTGSGTVNMTMEGYDKITLAEDSQGNPTSKNTYKIENSDTVQIAVKKLDKRYNFSIKEYETYLNFPTIGREGNIYRDLTNGVDYIWDDDEDNDGLNPHYIRKSANTIFCGGAAE